MNDGTQTIPALNVWSKKPGVKQAERQMARSYSLMKTKFLLRCISWAMFSSDKPKDFGSSIEPVRSKQRMPTDRPTCPEVELTVRDGALNALHRKMSLPGTSPDVMRCGTAHTVQWP
uniref:Uncharacterized protein n=1 Tax=Anopheles coluzzii TaxID=1518534 RepID=A0A8W7PUX5_ANOCL